MRYLGLQYLLCLCDASLARGPVDSGYQSQRVIRTCRSTACSFDLAAPRAVYKAASLACSPCAPSQTHDKARYLARGRKIPGYFPFLNCKQFTIESRLLLICHYSLDRKQTARCAHKSCALSSLSSHYRDKMGNSLKSRQACTLLY